MDHLDESLLRETLRVIWSFEKRPLDIVFIGSLDKRHECSWEEFAALAKDFKPHRDKNGSGVPLDLIVEFRDGSMLYREKYEDYAFWQMQTTRKRIASLGGIDHSWHRIGELPENKEA